MATGWIGVKVDGYRDDNYCGTSGWRYTTSVTSSIYYATNLCTDPAGIQEFRTVVHGRVYNGDSYTQVPSVFGPSQND